MANFWELVADGGSQKLEDPGDPSMPYGPPLWSTPQLSSDQPLWPTPQMPSRLNESPFELAAEQRVRAAKPKYGRIEGRATSLPEEFLIPKTMLDYALLLPPLKGVGMAGKAAILGAAAAMNPESAVAGPLSKVFGWFGSKPTAKAFATWEAIPGRGTGHLEDLIDLPYPSRERFSNGVFNAFTDPRGRNILHDSLGLETREATDTTGAYRPDGAATGSPLEVNPSRAFGVEVPLQSTHGAPLMMDPYDAKKMDAANALYALMTGQRGAPFHALHPDAGGTNTFIPLDKKVATTDMLRTATEFDGRPYAFADTGRGTSVLNFGNGPVPTVDAERMRGLLGGGNAGPMRSVADAERTYFDAGRQWDAGVGSRQVTEKSMAKLNELKPADFDNLDSLELRVAAGALFDHYAKTARAIEGAALRPDLMNALAIVRDQGLAGLRKSLSDPSQLLPVLGAIGLSPSLFQQFPKAEAEEVRQ